MTKASSLHLVAAIMAALAGITVIFAQTTGSATTTAWHDGQFHVETAAFLHRSDIVLERPNQDASEAMPLGNGHFGAAVWSADGLTVQLNRADTLPDRLSPGQVVVPGLSALPARRIMRAVSTSTTVNFASRAAG